ncbi:hypothetical protein [Amycolatopsis sp. NPDC051372]|uniref:hypothetical protein n=1 Tax=unclassified Amycolatopsis TaxID=2618356 RepID=UPI0034292F8F
MPDDRRVLRDLEADLRPNSFTTRAFAVRAAAERVSWRAVLVFAEVTAALAFVTGVFGADGGLAFGSFLAGCALGFLHTARLAR